MSGDSGRARRFARRLARRRSARVQAAEAIEHALIHTDPDPATYAEMRRIASKLRQRGERTSND